MPWHARLDLNYRRDPDRTVLRHAHTGPLRILKSLYPEGDAICHNVIVHPPGGLVGGDTLDVHVHAAQGAHALLSTPGATRFYRSDGPTAIQNVTLELAPEARLEWLPLETIAYPGCQAHNSLSARLGEGAEWLGWDICALGLPAAGQPFAHGCYTQRLEIADLWQEQARIDASDARLLASPLGLGNQRCFGTLWFASGTPLSRSRRETLLDAVRATLENVPPEMRAGATCPHPQVLVVRGVAPLVEPLTAVFQRAWAALRAQAWGLGTTPPRIWGV